MALNQYAKTERDFTSLLNSANMSPADRDKLSAILASLVNTQTLVPGVEQQITDIETEIGDIVAAINNIKVPVWKMQVFDANGTFTVPDAIAGNVVYVTGSGGGASGAAGVGISVSMLGAASGCYIERQPVTVSAGDSIAVTIGAGGAPVSYSGGAFGSVEGSDGSDSLFGPLLIAGASKTRLNDGTQAGGWIGGSPSQQAQGSIRYKSGLKAPQVSGANAYGAAAGAFGDGADGVTANLATATGNAAPANSGAGGGSCAVYNNDPVYGGPYTATSGAGGSGKVIVEWQEFA